MENKTNTPSKTEIDKLFQSLDSNTIDSQITDTSQQKDILDNLDKDITIDNDTADIFNSFLELQGEIPSLNTENIDIETLQKTNAQNNASNNIDDIELGEDYNFLDIPDFPEDNLALESILNDPLPSYDPDIIPDNNTSQEPTPEEATPQEDNSTNDLEPEPIQNLEENPLLDNNIDIPEENLLDDINLDLGLNDNIPFAPQGDLEEYPDITPDNNTSQELTPEGSIPLDENLQQEEPTPQEDNSTNDLEPEIEVNLNNPTEINPVENENNIDIPEENLLENVDLGLNDNILFTPQGDLEEYTDITPDNNTSQELTPEDSIPLDENLQQEEPTPQEDNSTNDLEPEIEVNLNNPTEINPVENENNIDIPEENLLENVDLGLNDNILFTPQGDLEEYTDITPDNNTSQELTPEDSIPLDENLQQEEPTPQEDNSTNDLEPEIEVNLNNPTEINPVENENNDTENNFNFDDNDFNFDNLELPSFELKIEDLDDIGIEQTQNFSNNENELNNNIDTPNNLPQEEDNPIEESLDDSSNEMTLDIWSNEENNEDQKINNLKRNLSLLPEELTAHIKHIFEQSTDAHLIDSVRKELENPFCSVDHLIELSQFNAIEDTPPPSHKTRLSILFFSLLALLVGLSSYIGFSVFQQTQDKILKTGLNMIKDGRIQEGNQIFLHNDPNIDWYNLYTEALIDMGAFQMAEVKLFGDNNNPSLPQKGALEIEPYNKKTLINLANWYTYQGLYEQAISSNIKHKNIPAVSISQLREKYPKDLDILDMEGKAYINLASQSTDPAVKNRLLNYAYNLYNTLEVKNKNRVIIDSRLLEISFLMENPNFKNQILMLSDKNMLANLETDTLSKAGLFYLDKNSVGEAAQFFNTLKLKFSSKKSGTTFSSLAYYFMGKFYLMAGDLKSAENNLILSNYNNTSHNPQGEILYIKNTMLYGQVSHNLGRIYSHLLKQYNSDTEFNRKTRQDYLDLAYFHLNESQKYNPSNAMNHYITGDIEYSINKNYKKAIEEYTTTIEMLEQENKNIPVDLLFNYGNALYQESNYNESIKVLSNMRTTMPLQYPSLEYLLGMAYLQEEIYGQAVDKMNRALEFYTPELEKIQQKGYATSFQEEKALYFGSIINNNLGVIYQKEGNRLDNNNMKTQARTYFYTALELNKRINPNSTFTFPFLNIQNSLIENNINILNNSSLENRETLLYPYVPESIWEYK